MFSINAKSQISCLFKFCLVTAALPNLMFCAEEDGEVVLGPDINAGQAGPQVPNLAFPIIPGQLLDGQFDKESIKAISQDLADAIRRDQTDVSNAFQRYKANEELKLSQYIVQADRTINDANAEKRSLQSALTKAVADANAALTKAGSDAKTAVNANKLTNQNAVDRKIAELVAKYNTDIQKLAADANRIISDKEASYTAKLAEASKDAAAEAPKSKDLRNPILTYGFFGLSPEEYSKIGWGSFVLRVLLFPVWLVIGLLNVIVGVLTCSIFTKAEEAPELEQPQELTATTLNNSDYKVTLTAPALPSMSTFNPTISPVNNAKIPTGISLGDLDLSANMTNTTTWAADKTTLLVSKDFETFLGDFRTMVNNAMSEEIEDDNNVLPQIERIMGNAQSFVDGFLAIEGIDVERLRTEVTNITKDSDLGKAICNTVANHQVDNNPDDKLGNVILHAKVLYLILTHLHLALPLGYRVEEKGLLYHYGVPYIYLTPAADAPSASGGPQA